MNSTSPTAGTVPSGKGIPALTWAARAAAKVDFPEDGCPTRTEYSPRGIRPSQSHSTARGGISKARHVTSLGESHRCPGPAVPSSVSVGQFRMKASTSIDSATASAMSHPVDLPSSRSTLAFGNWALIRSAASRPGWSASGQMTTSRSFSGVQSVFPSRRHRRSRSR